MDTDIQNQCIKYGIKMIPKESILNIPVSTSKQSTPNRIVLIDDDKFTHLNWKRTTSQSKIEFSSFYNIDDFLKESDQFDLETPIYIDSNLGDGQKGEVESKRIYDLGFENLYLATATKKEDIEVPFWIKDVLGKRLT